MLILLDIDGVMAPAQSWKMPQFLSDGFPEFSGKAVKALQHIIATAAADILLTTSHKKNYTINQWHDIFKLRGITVNRIFTLPENLNLLNRKDEIMLWVNATKPLPDFIIIDDDKSLNGLPEVIKKRLIQTSSGIGLTEDLANQALLVIARDL